MSEVTEMFNDVRNDFHRKMLQARMRYWMRPKAGGLSMQEAARKAREEFRTAVPRRSRQRNSLADKVKNSYGTPMQPAVQGSGKSVATRG